MPGDELGEVAPVRADVGERARRAAEVRVHPPVVVLRPGQPVLQVAAVHEADRAGAPAAHTLARLAHHRVVAVHEGHERTAVGLAGQLGQPRGPGEVERQRLLADDMLAGQQRGLGEREVEVVGRAHVHDIDVGRLDQRLGRLERAVGTEPPGRGLGVLERRIGHADQPRSRQPRSAGMHRADEARAGDADA
jgi:hypothetical protein